MKKKAGREEAARGKGIESRHGWEKISHETVPLGDTDVSTWNELGN